MGECVTRRKWIVKFLTWERLILISLICTAFLYRAFPHFIVYRWLPCEEEYNYLTVEELLETGTTHLIGFYPLLTHYLIYILVLLTHIDPVILCQYFNPFIGALSIIPLYFIAKQFFSTKQSLIICMIWSFSEASFYRTAYFGTTEPFAFMLCLISQYFYIKKRYVPSIIFLAVSFYSHLLPGFHTVIVYGIDLLMKGTKKQKISILFLLTILILFFFSPLNPHQRAIEAIKFVKLNPFIYNLNDIMLGLNVFSGLMVLFIFSILSFFKQRTHSFWCSSLHASILFFAGSWLTYNPYFYGAPRMTFYFVVPLSFFAIHTIKNHHVIIIGIILSSLLATLNGLQPMLWIGDAMTENEYKALDDLEKLNVNFTSSLWFTDYPVNIAITRKGKTIQTIQLSKRNETVIKYVFLSERNMRNGLFIERKSSRNLIVHKPIQDIWKNSSDWILIYNKYGVKIYERK